MKKLVIIISLFLLGTAFSVNAQEMTQKEKNNYAIGILLGQKINEEIQKSEIDISIFESIKEKLKEKIDFEFIIEGFRDIMKGESKLPKEEIMSILSELEKEKEKIEAFIKANQSKESEEEKEKFLYNKLIEEAFGLYESKKYLMSGQKYAEAFIAAGDKGIIRDRYNAACSWALAGENDAAFAQLFRIVKNGNFTHLGHITEDSDLNSLHKDKRWNQIIKIVKSSRKKEFAKVIKNVKSNEKNGLSPKICWNNICE
jgi:hypothetical protein